MNEEQKNNSSDIETDSREKFSCEEKLAECEKLRDEYLSGWQRQKADFINYRNETEKRIREISDFANEDLIFDLLPILDNFDVSLKSLRQSVSSDDKIILGVEMIRQQIFSVLKSRGLEEVSSVGEKFDPVNHEAIGTIESEGEEKDGIVAEETNRGYRLNGKTIRPARVKIFQSKK